jgi:GT2 family glycosyltransferase
VLVYVILVNWNGWADTSECVESCARLRGVDFQLIVVDNHSDDDSVSQLASRFPDLRVVQSDADLGFAGGNNLGIELALAEGADFVWVLNNDTTVAPEALEALVRSASENPDAGMFGSKVFYYANPQVIWYAGGELAKRKAGYPLHIGADQLDDGRFDSVRSVEFITGCSLLVRRQVIEQIGLMREDYFMYWEDVDWCARAQAAGWECLYVPTSRVWHKVSASMRGSGRLDLRYETRNRLYFYSRNRRRRFAAVLFWTLRDIVALAVKAKWENAGARLAGVADFLLGRSGAIC